MASRIQVGIIGLGKFGLAFGKALVDLGQEVMGIDTDMDNVRRAQDILTQVYQADGAEKKALEQLGFSDMTHVMVSVGGSIESSAMISLYLKELDVSNVWVKAISSDHEKLLRKIGVTEVIFPERYAANQLANKLAVPGLIEYLPFGQDVALLELTVSRWDGRTLRELALTSKYGVQVIAVRKAGEERFGFIPKADEPLRQGDTLIIIGQRSSFSALKS